MGGTVDSPTPMVPISSDSTSVICSSSPSCCARAAAATHPAVPPPAITTFFTAVPVVIRVSAIQEIDQHRAQLPRARFVERAQHTARLLREMRAGALGGPEHVVLED